MKFLRMFMFSSVALTILAAVFLFRVKHEVLFLEKHIFSLTGNIRNTEEETSVLRNEMFVLTTPKRIDALRQVYLKDHQRLRGDQIVEWVNR